MFYKGRAPHGQKTDWIMHEYRLEDPDDPQANPSVCLLFEQYLNYNIYQYLCSNSAVAENYT